MSYRIAGIDVHKEVLAVVVSNVEIEGEYQFEQRKFGSNPTELSSLAAWLLEKEVEEVVTESTAQYWKPVWEALERYWKPISEKRSVSNIAIVCCRTWKSTYNSHLGLPRSERCWGEHQTVYSGLCEAGVVMTSPQQACLFFRNGAPEWEELFLLSGI